MMTAEHRKPFAAFLVVLAVACLIVVNGLQAQVVEVFIGAESPDQAVGASASDLLLGQTLSGVPRGPQARSDAPAELLGPSTQAELPVYADQDGTQPIPHAVASVQGGPRGSTSTGHGDAGGAGSGQASAAPHPAAGPAPTAAVLEPTPVTNRPATVQKPATARSRGSGVGRNSHSPAWGHLQRPAATVVRAVRLLTTHVHAAAAHQERSPHRGAAGSHAVEPRGDVGRGHGPGKGLAPGMGQAIGQAMGQAIGEGHGHGSGHGAGTPGGRGR